MKLYRLAALPLAGALALAPVLATPAFAAHAKPHAAHATRVRPVPFTAVGTLTAVDASAGTVTVSVRSGTRSLRGQTVTVTVAARARVRLGETATTLAALPTGGTVTVVGTRTGGTLTASRVLAHSGS